jgi:hypothetical protein
LWNHFIHLVNTRFNPPLTKSPIGKLALLRRDDTIEDYCNKFMAMSCQDLAISKDHQVQLFTAGLGHHLRTNVALQKPVTLDEVVMYARAYAQRDSLCVVPPSTASRSTPHTYRRPPPTPTALGSVSGHAMSMASVNGPPPVTKYLTPTEIM